MVELYIEHLSLDIILIFEREAIAQKWLHGVVGYHVSLTRLLLGSTEGPQIEPG
jgi:hypothetical protein